MSINANIGLFHKSNANKPSLLVWKKNKQILAALSDVAAQFYVEKIRLANLYEGI